MSDERDTVFVIINNIPRDYRSSDLRNFFSQFIETKGFKCFHFRHRPEVQLKKRHIDDGVVDKDETQSKSSNTCCCVARVYTDRCDELLKMYHRKHWLDSNGESISKVCHISKAKIQQSGDMSSKYKTRGELKQIPSDRETFTEADLMKLPELHPPAAMPNGNVGTPTSIFMEAIRQCKLPPIVIKKLGLKFPKTRVNNRYGNVSFDYGGEKEEPKYEESGEEAVLSGCGHKLVSEEDFEEKTDRSDEQSQKVYKRVTRKDPETKKRMEMNIEEDMIHKEDNDSEHDDDSCEEWERHEALTDDPTNQERNKDRLFEEEIELKWEKGGSGLVFYTDAQYWQEQEGDFDEQTTDDWDVDMSVYYEDGAGDKDARDHVTMRQEKRRRDGEEATDRFTVGIGRKRKLRVPKEDHKIGRFESHTKGVGRKILEKQGWQEGEGLGSSVKGIAEALENDGQNPKDRKGFGYRGEKLVRPTGKSQRADREVIISTVYDDHSKTDPQNPLLRRGHHYHIKYRDKVDFTKPQESQGYIDN
ncbi:G patch domain-containing protein 3-like [Saccostrea cucullata]|uniref:G patch domain-containing protein 3-like n=1 Tax=Saccostrea cuccullata TaxID=36930 RepID=UPI002ED630D6